MPLLKSLFEALGDYKKAWDHEENRKRLSREDADRAKLDKEDEGKPMRAFDDDGNEIPWPPTGSDMEKPPATMIGKRFKSLLDR